MNRIKSEMSFEQYAAWARSRYPGFRDGDEPLSPAEDAVYSTAETEPPVSYEACPVTVKSARRGVIVTPNPKRSA